ncbi:hypothetical protein FBUS_11628 [Fasciolopsis buskii]|uniref:Uncharacterized protein n=1 Tax=Fasciolopsis buskii TaxID=27845 RepID=A0A8E0RKX8_9TREM|nr:hypothetical protein FBUS_11628 [Fasciolopsis buski]
MGLENTAERLFGKYRIHTENWSLLRVAAAVLTHEALGLGLLVGFWVGCYRYQPLKQLMHRAPRSVQVTYHRGMAWSERKLRNAPDFIKCRTDPQRLLISGAESFVIRKLLTPITIPGKIYLSVLISGFFQ